MQDLPEFKRNYQAEVHFALGAVIQGITVAAHVAASSACNGATSGLAGAR
jgi:hypothetical protein